MIFSPLILWRGPLILLFLIPDRKFLQAFFQPICNVYDVLLITVAKEQLYAPVSTSILHLGFQIISSLHAYYLPLHALVTSNREPFHLSRKYSTCENKWEQMANDYCWQARICYLLWQQELSFIFNVKITW